MTCLVNLDISSGFGAILAIAEIWRHFCGTQLSRLVSLSCLNIQLI